MLIPYSTDAPIYHPPYMTVGLIVINAITFYITGMGLNSEGWLLTYGDGLHPLEWLAYNFLHFGPVHLAGNMYFLWSFGIVIEGKLGWWKFLVLYLTIGVIGGILIQTAMLGFVDPHAGQARQVEPLPRWGVGENSLFAQENQMDEEEEEEDADEEMPAGKPVQGRINLKQKPLHDAAGGKAENEEADGRVEILFKNRPGAGGASLIIYGLMAITLIWAPRNEVNCFYIFGFRMGTCELEYLYFCGSYIVTEVLSAALSAQGLVISSEVGHATGALVGAGVGTFMVKQNWVDCENWDLFAIMAGRHGALTRVGDWQENYIPRARKDEVSIADVGEEGLAARSTKKKKKSKPKPKLEELESLDDSFPELVEVDVEDNPFADLEIEEHSSSTLPADSQTLPSKAVSESLARVAPPPPIPKEYVASFRDPTEDLRERVPEKEVRSVLPGLGRRKPIDPQVQLSKEELRSLANKQFKTRATDQAVPLLTEFIDRFGDDADRERVKLAVLYVKFLQRPIAALKLLVKINQSQLPEDYQSIFSKTKVAAQQMISDGVTDAVD